MAKKKRAPGRPLIQFKEEDVLAAIKGSRGIIARIAGNLKCDWTTADNHIKRFPGLTEALRAETEGVLDVCEDKLHKAINLDDIGTIKWYLSKKGKERGYGDELAVAATVETVTPIQMNISFRPPAKEDSPPESGE